MRTLKGPKGTLIAAVLFILFLIVMLWLTDLVLGITGIGDLATLFRQGAGGGLKLFACLVVLAVPLLCLWVFFRQHLESHNLLEKQDEWVDWKTELDFDSLKGPAVQRRQKHDDKNDAGPPQGRSGRSSLKHRRKAPPRVYWGYNQRR